MCCTEGRFVPGGSKARLKADTAAAVAAWRRTATYRGELRSCFTGWLPLFKIIPFACSWDYICLSDQASGNHLGTNARARARARAIRCESCLSLHSRLVVASLSLLLCLSFSLSLVRFFFSRRASLLTGRSLNTRGKFASHLHDAIAGFSPWQCKRKRGTNPPDLFLVSLSFLLSLFPFFGGGIFLFSPAKKRPHRERWLVASVFIEQ